MSLDERDYMRDRPYMRASGGRWGSMRFLWWMVAVVGLLVVLALAWLVGMRSKRYGGCWHEMGSYINNGVVVGCFQENTGIVVGISDARWSVMSRGEKLLLVASVDSFMRLGRGGTRVELRGDPSGIAYWVQTYVRKRVPR